MNDNLERLLACDEEGRARLEMEWARARESIESLGRRLQEERDRRRRELEEELERELVSIGREAERAAAERRRRRDEFGAGQAALASTMLSKAVDAFVRIVRDGPPAGTR